MKKCLSCDIMADIKKAFEYFSYRVFKSSLLCKSNYKKNYGGG